MMARAYKDADDENASSVVIATAPGHLVISLGYQGWSHDKEGRTVVLLVGGKVVDLRSKMAGDDTQMTGEFTEALLPHFSGADTIVLRFKDGDADFKIPAFAEAFETFETLQRGAGEAGGDGDAGGGTHRQLRERALLPEGPAGVRRGEHEPAACRTRRQARGDASGDEPGPGLIEGEINKRAADPTQPFWPKSEKAAAFSGAIDQYLTCSPEPSRRRRRGAKPRRRRARGPPRPGSRSTAWA